MKPPFPIRDEMVYVISAPDASLIWWTNGYVSINRHDGSSANQFGIYVIPSNWQLIGP